MLDIDVRDDGSRLNAASPRLVIAVFRYRHQEVDDNLVDAFFLSLLLAVTGFGLFIHSYNAQRHEALICPLTVAGPQLPLAASGSGLPERAIRPRRIHPNPPATARKYGCRELSRLYVWPFQKLHWFGLIASCIFLSTLLGIFALQSFRWAPRGLPIRLLRTDIGTKAQPGVEPLLVRIDADGGSVVRSLYIGSHRVPSKDFDIELRKGLAVRPPNWPVYVEGAPDVEWQSVANAIDEIRGFNAEVVLLKFREGRR